jgi:hypothetical protein
VLAERQGYSKQGKSKGEVVREKKRKRPLPCSKCEGGGNDKGEGAPPLSHVWSGEEGWWASGRVCHRRHEEVWGWEGLLIVLGKFGLVQFKPLLAKPQTKLKLKPN